jgi:hypothetical protein
MRKFFYGNFFMNVPFSLCSEFGAIGESGDTRGPLELHATYTHIHI